MPRCRCCSTRCTGRRRGIWRKFSSAGGLAAGITAAEPTGGKPAGATSARRIVLGMIRFALILTVAASAVANEALVVDSVTIAGADLRVKLETQVGRPYDPAAVAHDVRYLW